MLRTLRFFAKNKLVEMPHAEVTTLLNSSRPLLHHILALIQRDGPMSLRKYWQLSLTHPDHGYYMKRDVFKDFVTAVQLSQLFCESIGVWIVHYLIKSGIRTKGIQPVALLELGAGTGTLTGWVLRVMRQLNFLNDLEINIVEVSGFMRRKQQQTIFEVLRQYGVYMLFEMESEKSGTQQFQDQMHRIKINWFNSLDHFINHRLTQDAVPTVVYANQFFDALPVQLIQRTSQGWKEKLIVASNNQDLPLDFKLADVLSNWNQQLGEKAQIGDVAQISVDSIQIVHKLQKFLKENGGSALFVDYGEPHPVSNSLRAIRNHKFVPWPYWLQMPGLVDLSAFVDFSIFGVDKVLSQEMFLKSMGIQARMQSLLQSVNKQTGQHVKYEFKVLTQDMGSQFKVVMMGKEVFPFSQF